MNEFVRYIRTEHFSPQAGEYNSELAYGDDVLVGEEVYDRMMDQLRLEMPHLRQFNREEQFPQEPLVLSEYEQAMNQLRESAPTLRGFLDDVGAVPQGLFMDDTGNILEPPPEIPEPIVIQRQDAFDDVFELEVVLEMILQSYPTHAAAA